MRNLQVFTTALATRRQPGAAFNTDLASVADQLAGEREELAAALKHLAVALGEVALVRQGEPGDPHHRHRRAGRHHRILAKQKDAMAEVLDAGPVALSNLSNAYNPSSGTLDTRDNAEQAQDPARYLCSLLTSTRRAEARLRADSTTC